MVQSVTDASFTTLHYFIWVIHEPQPLKNPVIYHFAQIKNKRCKCYNFKKCLGTNVTYAILTSW